MMETIMNETPKNKLGWRILRMLLVWLALFAAIVLSIVIFGLVKNIGLIKNLLWGRVIGTGVAGASVPICLWMSWKFIRWSCRCWGNLRSALIGLSIFATLVAIFYTAEDWRGKHAWEKCKAELEAKGMVLDWNKFIPPPVPDDQNFFMASTNILLRFKKAGAGAESELATKNPWLRIDYSTNCFAVFDSSRTGPLVVAEMAVEPSNVASAAAGKSQPYIAKLDAAGAREQLQDLIRTTIGRGISGAAGFQFSERQLSNLAPAQIVLQSDTTPSVADLQNLIPENLVTNIGHLWIEAVGGEKSFRVLLTGVRITAAADYLKWSDQFIPALDEVREALKRPYATIPGDYSQPFFQPFPNFITLRAVAQLLAQRAQCEFLLGQPDQALRELTLVHDLCRILEHRPTGQPTTLVEAMINVAINELYAATIADGFRFHAWREPQMAALEEQLKDINLPPRLRTHSDGKWLPQLIPSKQRRLLKSQNYLSARTRLAERKRQAFGRS